jgi:phosphatidylserine/phosphatidylglycerophosphate/cardiolipin synthase-like enzyme
MWMGWLWRGGGCLLLAAVLTGCAPVSAPPQSGGCGKACVPTPATASAVCAAASCGARAIHVFVEPDAGETPILSAISGARVSIWAEVYLLTDRTVIRALEDAVRRGVDVRVLLEAHPFGSGDISAARTLEELQAAGVSARPANPVFRYTHEKALVVDAATAYILTSNLSRSGLGGSASGANREYGVIDTDPHDVAQIAAIFTADWNHTTAVLDDQRLVVSPLNARAGLAALIGGAHALLQIEDEEMLDRLSEDLLIAAARRGVAVQIILPAPGASTPDSSADVMRLSQGGVRVRYLVAPYMHAKLVVADGAVAFIGSENFSSTSLDENRELGITIGEPQALATLSHVYAQDWALASAPH